MANEKIFNLDLSLDFPMSDYSFLVGTSQSIYFRPSRNNYVTTWNGIQSVNFLFIDSFEPSRQFEYNLSSTDFVTIDGEQLLKLTFDMDMMNAASYYKGTITLNTEPKANSLNISIFNNSSLEMQTLLKVIDKGEAELLVYLKAIKKDLLDSPDGVAVLNVNKKIEEKYLPTSYREHINAKLISGRAHQSYIDQEGIMWFYNTTSNEWRRLANQSVTPEDTPPTITVKDGYATIKYHPATIVVQQKWSLGIKDTEFFKTGGIIFSGTTIKVTQSGTYTLFYKNNKNKDYVVTFEVPETEIPFIYPTLITKNGIVTITHQQPEKIFLQKFDKGIHDTIYFQTNGLVINNSQFIVSESGIYYVYYKLTDGREFVQQLVINEGDLPEDKPPTLLIKDSIVTASYVSYMNILESKWAYGQHELDYFQTSGNTVINNRFEVFSAGQHTLYYVTDKKAYVMVFTVSPEQMKPDPAVTITVNKGKVLISYPSNVTVATNKWEKGNCTIAYFKDKGNVFTNNTFNIEEIGDYTLYYKLSDDKEYVKVFTVDITQLPPNIIPQYTVKDGNILISVSDKSLYTKNLYELGRVTVEDFRSGIGRTVIDWKIPYTQKGDVTHYYQADGKDGINVITITDNDLPHNDPIITIINGLVKISHSQPDGLSVVLQKWQAGDVALTSFTTQNQGSVITDNKFYVVQAGIHTLFYELSNGGQYIVKFTVGSNDLEKTHVPPTIGAVNGLVTVTFESNMVTTLRKWDNLSRNVQYFQSNGNIFTGNSFKVPEANIYTIYYKLDNEKEYVKEFTVSENQMKPAFIPPTINISRGIVTLIYDNSMNVTLNKWEYGENTVSYFENNGTIISDNKFKVDRAGKYTLYTVLEDEFKYVNTFDIRSDQLYIPDKAPTFSINQGIVTITHDQNTQVDIQKHSIGEKDIAFFATDGTAFTGNTFTVDLATVYTYYYKNTFGDEYIYPITVVDANLPYYQPSYSIVDGLLIINFNNPNNIVLSKIDIGNRDKEYFASNGIEFSNNEYQLTETGTYTIYWKQENGRDFVMPITASADQIAKHTPPTIETAENNVTVNYIEETEQYVTNKKWAEGVQTTDWFKSNGISLDTNTFTYDGKESTYYYEYKGRGYVILFGERAVLYGIKIDQSNDSPSGAVTYELDALDMSPAVYTDKTMASNPWAGKFPFNQIRPCVLDNSTGKVKYYLNPDNFNLKEDGTPSIVNGSDGDVMIEFPKIYWSSTVDGDTIHIGISNKQVDLTYKAHAHKKGDVEYDKLYISAFKAAKMNGSLGDAMSAFGTNSGTTVKLITTSSSSVGSLRSALSSRNPEYRPMTNYSLEMLQILFLLMYKNRDTQMAQGVGNIAGTVNDNLVVNQGTLAEKGMFYGRIVDQLSPGTGGIEAVKFLGIENLWGATESIIDGIFYGTSHTLKVSTDNGSMTDSNLFEDRVIFSAGYNTGYMKTADGRVGSMFLPKEGLYSATMARTYYPDYIGLSTTYDDDQYLKFGSRTRSRSGLFALEVDKLSSTSGASTYITYLGND